MRRIGLLSETWLCVALLSAVLTPVVAPSEPAFATESVEAVSIVGDGAGLISLPSTSATSISRPKFKSEGSFAIAVLSDAHGEPVAEWLATHDQSGAGVLQLEEPKTERLKGGRYRLQIRGSGRTTFVLPGARVETPLRSPSGLFVGQARSVAGPPANAAVVLQVPLPASPYRLYSLIQLHQVSIEGGSLSSLCVTRRGSNCTTDSRSYTTFQQAGRGLNTRSETFRGRGAFKADQVARLEAVNAGLTSDTLLAVVVR